MATLTGNQIDLTYQGLIKLDDNGAIDPTVLKQITDGTGGSLPIQVSQVQTKFQSLVDFTNATVTGISSTDTTYTIGSTQDGANADIVLTDNLGGSSKATLVAGANITLTNVGNDLTIAASGGGAAGLVSGTGTDSIVSAASLTTTAALAPEDYSIAIGDGANIEGTASNNAGVAIGKNVKTIYSGGISIGRDIQQSTASFNASEAISVGIGLRTEGSKSINYGVDNNILGGGGGNRGAFGQNCSVDGSVSGNFAIGFQVTAAKANTVTVKELETELNGGGITMHSPNGTEYKLTVSDAGALVIS